MRTIQKTYTLFILDELKDEARQRAYSDWLAKGYDYPFASDNRHTLDAFCALFGIVCTRYSYDSTMYNYSFHTRQEEDVEQLAGIRLQTYLYNNFYSGIFKSKTYRTKDCQKKRESRVFVNSECPLTGFIMDDIILQPLYDFLQRPDGRTFKELMRDCLCAFFRSCHDDCEYCESEEHFKDESLQNDWEYLSDGTLFKETA